MRNGGSGQLAIACTRDVLMHVRRGDVDRHSTRKGVVFSQCGVLATSREETSSSIDTNYICRRALGALRTWTQTVLLCQSSAGARSACTL